jgi:hypothetical protein
MKAVQFWGEALTLTKGFERLNHGQSQTYSFLEVCVQNVEQHSMAVVSSSSGKKESIVEGKQIPQHKFFV